MQERRKKIAKGRRAEAALEEDDILFRRREPAGRAGSLEANRRVRARLEHVDPTVNLAAEAGDQFTQGYGSLRTQVYLKSRSADGSALGEVWREQARGRVAGGKRRMSESYFSTRVWMVV